MFLQLLPLHERLLQKCHVRRGSGSLKFTWRRVSAALGGDACEADRLQVIKNSRVQRGVGSAFVRRCVWGGGHKEVLILWGGGLCL